MVAASTVASYEGVPEDTPEYRSGYYGSARRGVGLVSELDYSGPVVLNYADSATVLAGCMLAIEITGDEARWIGWLRKVHTYALTRFCDEEGGGDMSSREQAPGEADIHQVS